MLTLLNKIPRHITLAVSGGIDSMAALNFLCYNHTVDVAFFDHGTKTSEDAFSFLTNELKRYKINNFFSEKIDSLDIPKGISKEEHWRNQRYKFFSKFECVVTAHHLDDVAETWIWSSLHGQSKLIPYKRNNVIRPFLTSRKFDLEKWAKDKSVNYVFDKSNNDTSYTRNYIRHNLMQHALKVNPGLHSMLRKKLTETQKMIHS
jgi:tRNA(Ile)-lysidine synthase